MDTAKSHDILHPSHYGLDDVYSSYFPVSPRSPEDISVAGSSKHIRQMKSTDTKYWDTLQPSSNDHDPHPLPENLQIPASTFAAYRDSPIIGKVLPFPPLSPDRPLTEKTYLWDPTEYEWRVVELDWISRSEAESQTQRPFQLPQLLAPRLRRKGHIRRASEPLNPQLLLQPPPPSPIVRTFGAYDLDESHPTLELVFRYSEPSPLTPAFNLSEPSLDSCPILELEAERRIYVQVLGAFGLNQTGVLKRNPKAYAYVSIAGQEFRTPTAERTTTPAWHSNFLFESVQDTDPVVIRVWSEAGSNVQHTWHGSFMCTVRRMLLMQASNDVLTFTLDRWPDEGQVLESTQCGSIILSIRDLTSPTTPHEPPIPLTPISNLPKLSKVSSQFANSPGPFLLPVHPRSRRRISRTVATPIGEFITPSPPSPQESMNCAHPKWFTDIVGRTLSLTKGRYPWVPTGDVTIVDGPVCGGRYCDIYMGELQRAGIITRVALKQLRVFTNASDNMRKMFCREVQFWSKLRHLNVLPFWGCWELDEYRLFMISPWASNGNSLQYVQRYPGADRRRILLQSAEALAYLHSGEEGDALVHGDLKADNVLISETGDALLADFGLTRYVEKLASVSGTPSGISAHGHTRFSAPELLLPQSNKEPRPTPESDVFAFACFLVQLYTEELPFVDIKVEAQVITEIIGGRTPSRPMGLAIQRGLDDDIWKLANDCWQFVASRRPLMTQVANRLR